MSATRPEFDPFVVPTDAVAIADVSVRQRVPIRGVVTSVDCCQWNGGPVLEVTVDDGTGCAVLALLGRRNISGVTCGTALTAAGTMQLHRGRLIVMNPLVWLHSPEEAATEWPTRLVGHVHAGVQSPAVPGRAMVTA